MKIRVLLYGLTIMLISNILMLSLVYELNIRSFVSMFLFIIVAFISWKLLLKKDVSIGFKTTNFTVLKQTMPLIIIPLFAIAYFIHNFTTINYSLISLMLLTSLATGVYEELIFRGITLGSLVSANMKPSIAIFISAGLFAIFHLVSAYTYSPLDIALKLLNTFMMGVIFGYIYYVTNNILLVISIHTVWDFESFLAQNNTPNNIDDLATIILFAMSVLYFSWSYKKILRL